jgi:hypothetical protein
MLPTDSVPASYWDVPTVTAKGCPLIDDQSGRILDAALTKIGQEKITAGGKVASWMTPSGQGGASTTYRPRRLTDIDRK